MKTIILTDVSPKRRYSADYKHPECSNYVIDRLIELIENGEKFTQTVRCIVKSGYECYVSICHTDMSFLDIDFEEEGNPVYIDYFKLKMQIFRWDNKYYYLTY